MATRVAHEVFKGEWFIAKSYAQAYLPQIAQLFNGEVAAGSDNKKVDSENAHAAKPNEGIVAGVRRAEFNPYYEGYGVENLEPGTVAVVPVTGAIMKYDYCGAAGTKSIGKTLRKLDASPNVEQIVLSIDSGGGSVAGTKDLGAVIEALETPTLAYIDDLAASAAYWIASQCDLIYANNDQAEIGSIGVYTTIADWASYYEKEGLPIIEIYSSLSSEKNQDYKEALEGKPEKLRARLDVLAQGFIDTVAAARPQIDTSKGDPYKGAVFFAPKAQEIGLIDGYGTELEAISQLQTISNNNTHSDMIGGKFPELKASRKAEALDAEQIAAINAELATEEVPGFFVAATEEIATAEEHAAALVATDKKVQDLTAALETAKTTAETATTALAGFTALFGEEAAAEDFDMEAHITALQADAKAHRELAGQGAEGGAGGADPDAAEETLDMDNMPHNQKADAMGFGAKSN